MPCSKVVYGGKTLIDLTNVTVTADTLAEGVTALDAAGNEVVGTMPTLDAIMKEVYPVGTIYKATVSTNPKTLLGFGTWTLVKKQVTDTGWQDFSWKDETYINTAQRSFTRNQWRVKDNVLYVQTGVGMSSAISTSTEAEFAQIPITGGWSSGNQYRIFAAGVGGSGALYGAYLQQQADRIGVYLKPHTTANNHTSPWFSLHFAVPMDDDFAFATGSYDVEYHWKRTA